MLTISFALNWALFVASMFALISRWYWKGIYKIEKEHGERMEKIHEDYERNLKKIIGGDLS